MAVFEKGLWQTWIAHDDQHAKILSDKNFEYVGDAVKGDLIPLDQMLAKLRIEQELQHGHPIHMHPWFAQKILIARESYHDR